jgi:hypothetical protein
MQTNPMDSNVATASSQSVSNESSRSDGRSRASEFCMSRESACNREVESDIL